MSDQEDASREINQILRQRTSLDQDLIKQLNSLELDALPNLLDPLRGTTLTDFFLSLALFDTKGKKVKKGKFRDNFTSLLAGFTMGHEYALRYGDMRKPGD